MDVIVRSNNNNDNNNDMTALMSSHINDLDKVTKTMSSRLSKWVFMSPTR